MGALNKHNAWPVNVMTYNLMRLKPNRNKKLWVFGAWMGQKYDDNARFLFEYIHQHHSNSVRAVWLSDNKMVVEQVRRMGCEAYLNCSKEGKRCQKEAGAAIYTHGLDDFGMLPLVGGAKIISLWHGVGGKKIYNAKFAGIKLALKKAMDFFFMWQSRDVTIVTSEYVKELFGTIFSLKKDAIYYITGQPRNDVLFGLNKEEVLSNVDIDKSKRIILYMPTYRMKTMGENAVQKLVEGIYYNERFNKALTATNSVFLIKPHPVTPKLELKNRNNFIVLDNDAVESNQKLLGVADMLVTDYSSCSVDYALLERPVVFYVPDEKEYLEKSEPIFDVFMENTKYNRCETIDDLAEAIINPSNEATDALNEVYNDPSTRDENNCKRVYECIVKELGI